MKSTINFTFYSKQEVIFLDTKVSMSFFADTDALKWARCKVVIPRHCAEMLSESCEKGGGGGGGGEGFLYLGNEDDPIFRGTFFQRSA